MTDVNELKSAIKEILLSNGSLNKIRAEIREEIYKAIEEDSNPKPKIPEENLLINELIREYFSYMGYNHANSVFLSESGHPEDSPIDRNFISKELNIYEDKNSKSLPLIYSLLFSLKKETYEPSSNFMQSNKGNNSITYNNVNPYTQNSYNPNPNQYSMYDTNHGLNNSNKINFNSSDQPKPIEFSSNTHN